MDGVGTGDRTDAGAHASPIRAPVRIRRETGSDGRTVWVKHFAAETPRLPQRLHARLSARLPAGPWRASPLVDAQGLMERERRKSAAFVKAGIAVPGIMAAGPDTLSIADAGPDAERVLKGLRAEGRTLAHDDLLVRLAASLAAIHEAGLCHGRPHLRDAAPRDGEIVWFDFEEEPEAVMPLADAQARDLWLLFFQICRKAIGPETPDRALSAYRDRAPTEVCERLRVHLSRIAWTLPFARLLRRIHAGGDLVRYLGATAFLLTNLASPDVPLARSPEPPSQSLTRFER